MDDLESAFFLLALRHSLCTKERESGTAVRDESSRSCAPDIQVRTQSCTIILLPITLVRSRK